MNNWLYTYTLEGKCYDADRTEYALKNISYWEFAEDGETVLLYDYDGNIYEW